MKLTDSALKIVTARYFLDDKEDWEKLSIRVGKEAARYENSNYSERFTQMIFDGDFLPGGRILRNMGRPRGSLFNCFVLPVGDSREEIGQWLKDSLILWGEGGGVGCNVSFLRPKGAPIKGVGGSSSGPVSFLEASDAVAKTVESGGSRRAAALATMLVSHPDILNFIDAKLVHGKLSHYNISVAVTEEFLEAVEKNDDWEFKFAQQSYGKIKAKDIWKKIMDNMVRCAEPGLLNWDNLRSNNSYYWDPILSTNPCLSNDIKVLTKQGHFEIQDLVGKEVEIWDGNQWIKINNFRVTGENQKMLKITLYDGSELRVTPYHKFYLSDGREPQAKDLSIGDKLLYSNAPLVHGNIEEKGAYVKGFLLGDGGFDNNKQSLFLNLYNPKYCCEDRLINSASEIPVGKLNTNVLTELKFNYEKSNDRKNLTGLTVRKNELNKWCNEYKTKLPKEIFQWNLKSKCEFIAGYFDADGNVRDLKTSGFGYQIWANSKEMLLDIQLLLKTIGIQSKLSVGKLEETKNFNDGYGEYKCQKSYRLNITQRHSIELSKIVKFTRLKDFSDREMKYFVKEKYNRVIFIEEDGIDEKVYCCNVPTTHSFALSNWIYSSNCGEVPLGANAVCDLGSLVLPNFITGSVNTNWKKLEQTIKLAVRFLDNIIDINKYVLHEIDVSAHNGRRIGLGVMGLAEYLFSKKLRYGSKKAIDEIEKLMKFIRDTAYEASVEIAIEKGAFPKFDPVQYGKAHFIRTLPAALRMLIKDKGIRNVTLMAMAPTGTISLIPEVSSGIEPLFSKAYLRKDRVSERVYIHPLYKAIMESGEELPEWFVDVKDLKPADHFETQSIIQRYTDGAVSKCVDANTRLSTSKGLIKISDMSDNRTKDSFKDIDFDVISINDIKKANSFYYNGIINNGVKIETSNGFCIEGTPLHKIKCLNRNHELIWKSLQDINESDIIAIKMDTCIVDSAVQRLLSSILDKEPFYFEEYGNNKPINIPTKSSKKLCWWLGCLFSDGSIIQSNNTISFCQVSGPVLNTFVQVTKELFDIDCRPIKDSRRDNLFNANISSKKLHTWLTDYIEFNKERIPELIFRVGKLMIKSFIEGMTLDGYATDKIICLKTDKSLDVIKDLQLLCAHIDIPTYILPNYNKTYNKYYYNLNVESDGILTLNNFSFPEEHKNNQLKQNIQKTGIIRRQVFMFSQEQIPISDEFISTILNIQNKCVNSSRLYNIFHHILNKALKNKTLTLDSILTVYTFMDNIPEVFNNKLILTKVKSISTDMALDTMDISVAEKHSYIANGFISHNTINMPKGTTPEDLSRLTLEYIRDLKGLTVYVDESREGQILTHMTDKEVRNYIKSSKEVEKSASEETVRCASGSCEL